MEKAKYLDLSAHTDVEIEEDFIVKNEDDTKKEEEE